MIPAGTGVLIFPIIGPVWRRSPRSRAGPRLLPERKVVWAVVSVAGGTPVRTVRRVTSRQLVTVSALVAMAVAMTMAIVMMVAVAMTLAVVMAVILAVALTVRWVCLMIFTANRGIL